MLQKRGKYWHTRFMLDGKLYQKSLRTTNYKQALSLESTFRSSVVKGEFDILDSERTPTLEKFRIRLFSHLRNNVAPLTYEWYEDYFNTLLKHRQLKETRLDRIDAPLIEDFVQKRMADKVAIITVNHSLRVLRRALHLAEDWKLIRRAPKVRLLRGEVSREYVIDEPTLQAIVQWIRTKFRKSNVPILLPFLVDTGLRITEACRLRRDTVSLEPKPGAERGWIFVEKGKSKYARRHIPLTERAADSVKQALEISKCDSVFTNIKGLRPMKRSQPTHVFRKAALALGLPEDAVMHSTRHTFCTRLGEAGVSAFEIQRLAGHSSITISQRYVHPSPPALEGAIGRLEKLKK